MGDTSRKSDSRVGQGEQRQNQKRHPVVQLTRQAFRYWLRTLHQHLEGTEQVLGSLLVAIDKRFAEARHHRGTDLLKFLKRQGCSRWHHETQDYARDRSVNTRPQDG